MKVTITNLTGDPEGVMDGAMAALGYLERGHDKENRRRARDCITCDTLDGKRRLALWGDADHIEVDVWNYGQQRE